MAKKKQSAVLLSRSTIERHYGWPPELIERLLPAPQVQFDPKAKGKSVFLWDRKDVLAVMKSPAFKLEKAVADSANTPVASPDVEAFLSGRPAQRKLTQDFLRQAAIAFLRRYDIAHMISIGKTLNRRFVLHCGPTNSGKTYHALKALSHASSGVYLGPLRLLALEVFDTLNEAGVPCSLLTGEESIDVPGSSITACTIEMLNTDTRYDVAVIDEAQLISNAERGGNWTSAILRVNAREVHICLAPEALDFIVSLISALGSPCEVIRHQRLTPLQYGGVMRSISKARPGDAFITFSRKGVLALAAELESTGSKVSVIYGALPPQARREEVRKFTDGETNIVVATDAIGLGVSLPIKRVVFSQTTKYDGKQMRGLTCAEVKQIAGRAGRYGKYPVGEVLSLNGDDSIPMFLKSEPVKIERAVIPFPVEALDISIPLEQLLTVWNDKEALKEHALYRRMDMTGPLALLKVISRRIPDMPKKQVFSCISCPVDENSDIQVGYWLACCEAWYHHRPLPEPFTAATSNLSDCESRYRQLDILHQMARRAGQDVDTSSERDSLCARINALLKEDKSNFLRRCSRCGCILPATYAYGMCDACYHADDWF